jgi:hypothetical protein
VCVYRLTGTPESPLGRICPCSGRGSLSGQYITQGVRGSVDTFWTLPPLAKALPDGVSRGWDGGGGLGGFRASVRGWNEEVEGGRW